MTAPDAAGPAPREADTRLLADLSFAAGLHYGSEVGKLIGRAFVALNGPDHAIALSLTSPALPPAPAAPGPDLAGMVRKYGEIVARETVKGMRDGLAAIDDEVQSKAERAILAAFAQVARERETIAAQLSTAQAKTAALRERLEVLQIAECHYRTLHDIHGDGSALAGRAWDLMRRAGDAARAQLSRAATLEGR